AGVRGVGGSAGSQGEGACAEPERAQHAAAGEQGGDVEAQPLVDHLLLRARQQAALVGGAPRGLVGVRSGHRSLLVRWGVTRKAWRGGLTSAWGSAGNRLRRWGAWVVVRGLVSGAPGICVRGTNHPACLRSFLAPATPPARPIQSRARISQCRL